MLTCVRTFAVAKVVLGHPRPGAHGHAIPAVPALLDVRGDDLQRLADPLARREPHPGVRRLLRWMGPPVEPDCPLLRPGAHELLHGDDVLGRRVTLFGDPHADRAAQDVRRHVGAALVLGQRQAPRVPAVGIQPAGRVDRQAGVVARIGTRSALGLVLVEQAHPVAVQVALRPRRRGDDNRDDDEHDDERQAANHRVSRPRRMKSGADRIIGFRRPAQPGRPLI